MQLFTQHYTCVAGGMDTHFGKGLLHLTFFSTPQAVSSLSCGIRSEHPVTWRYKNAIMLFIATMPLRHGVEIGPQAILVLNFYIIP